MLSAQQRELIDKAAQIRGVDEISFSHWADEVRRDAVELAREVLFGAEDERGSIQQKASAAATAPKTSATAHPTRQRLTAETINGWFDEYRRCADGDVAGLSALSQSAFEHIKDAPMLVYALSLSTIHRIKREKLEARIAALEASDFRKSEERVSYQGVFEAGAVYEPGDVVTHGGTLWHCWERTTDRPGTKSWQLMVKTR
jgi:hypothetical protein